MKTKRADQIEVDDVILYEPRLGFCTSECEARVRKVHPKAGKIFLWVHSEIDDGATAFGFFTDPDAEIQVISEAADSPPGWDVFSIGGEFGPFEVQRCDDSDLLEDDFAAYGAAIAWIAEHGDIRDVARALGEIVQKIRSKE